MKRIFAVLVVAALSSPLVAQPGSSAANPFVESSAGRAWQRITFGAIDCADGEPACASDPFVTSGLFVNGTYRNIRFNYGGDVTVPNVAEFLGNRVVTQSQTFPTASTASGFTFSWQGGPTPVRDSRLFGPLFGHRGRTNGRGQVSVTATVQRLEWESLDGSKIRQGQSGLLWGDAAYLELDGVEFGYVGRCIMDIDTTVGTVAVGYGVTDRLDVSVAVPLVRTEIEGSNEFLDFARFADGTISVDAADTGFEPQGRFYVEGKSSGVGDVTLQSTFALIKRTRAALAVFGRVDFGTGSLDKMTGTGEDQYRAGLVGSYEVGRVAPHASLAYSSGSADLFDEISLIAGLDIAAIPDRLTLNAELVTRRLLDVQGFESGALLGTVRSPRTGDLFEVRDFRAVRGDFDLFFVALGGKLRIAGQLLGSGYVLIPTGSDGLQAQKPSFNFGVNYAF
jgi:hypothetical protein